MPAITAKFTPPASPAYRRRAEGLGESARPPQFSPQGSELTESGQTCRGSFSVVVVMPDLSSKSEGTGGGLLQTYSFFSFFFFPFSSFSSFSIFARMCARKKRKSEKRKSEKRGKPKKTKIARPKIKNQKCPPCGRTSNYRKSWAPRPQQLETPRLQKHWECRTTVNLPGPGFPPGQGKQQ